MGSGVGSVVDSPVPDPAGTSVALFGTWRVGTPERQQAAADAIAAAWKARPWPGAGLGSYGVLAGEDGDMLLHFSQLDDPDTAGGQDLTWTVPDFVDSSDYATSATLAAY